MLSAPPTRGTGLVAALVGVGLALAPAPADANACDSYAGAEGAAGAAGTAEDPFDGVQAAIAAAGTGGTACILGGRRVAADDEIRIEEPGVTLTSAPGEQGAIGGRIYVSMEGDGATISDLDIDGRNSRALALTINADRVSLVGNAISNSNTGICVIVGSPDPRFGRARGTLIESNEIHHCGALPATNFDHGIYVSAADGTVIRGNWIHDNADRGIQLYPDAQRSLISGNLISGNGQGLIFGGDEEVASSNNLVIGNTIVDSRIRDNVESSWAGPVGEGNLLIANCIRGGAYDEGDGGIMRPMLGFRFLNPSERSGTAPPCAPPSG